MNQSVPDTRCKSSSNKGNRNKSTQIKAPAWTRWLCLCLLLLSPTWALAALPSPVEANPAGFPTETLQPLVSALGHIIARAPGGVRVLQLITTTHSHPRRVPPKTIFRVCLILAFTPLATAGSVGWVRLIPIEDRASSGQAHRQEPPWSWNMGGPHPHPLLSMNPFVSTARFLWFNRTGL